MTSLQTVALFIVPAVIMVACGLRRLTQIIGPTLKTLFFHRVVLDISGDGRVRRWSSVFLPHVRALPRYI